MTIRKLLQRKHFQRLQLPLLQKKLLQKKQSQKKKLLPTHRRNQSVRCRHSPVLQVILRQAHLRKQQRAVMAKTMIRQQLHQSELPLMYHLQQAMYQLQGQIYRLPMRQLLQARICLQQLMCRLQLQPLLLRQPHQPPHQPLRQPLRQLLRKLRRKLL